MLSISKLYCGNEEYGDILRYRGIYSASKKPIVVWNVTSRCNLACTHCYANASLCPENSYELSTKDGEKLIDDLASFGVPVLLFSGGEPLMRDDIFELISYAASKGMRTVLSSNGTLIDKTKAEILKKIGISYVGISIDGREEPHDKFRCRKGAFRKTLGGIRTCVQSGLKVGLRFTMNKDNINDMEFIFDLMEKENIPRVCFYHLISSGRGTAISDKELSISQKRETLNYIIDKSSESYQRGLNNEILTVANHCDGIFLYLRMKKENHPDADKVLGFLKMNSSDSSGIGIASINWDGEVYPDQFWRTRVIGDIRKEKFSSLWDSSQNEFLGKLLNRRKQITGRCARCKFLDICGGNFRGRAEYYTGDTWASDPGCYLHDSEIM